MGFQRSVDINQRSSSPANFQRLNCCIIQDVKRLGDGDVLEGRDAKKLFIDDESKEPSMQLLEGEGITKRFGGLIALKDVDFYVNEGEIAGLIGPNGAGKTTLFNLISGALRSTSGMIKFEGKVISG
ncbi:MAG: ATP-binding cassette domain-containing protein, partial [Promethearchaeota archaeon]